METMKSWINILMIIWNHCGNKEVMDITLWNKAKGIKLNGLE